MSDLTHAVHEINAHADHYRLAASYYRGDVAELFTSPVVRRVLGRQAHGFDVNLARRPVDAVLDRMKITAIPVLGSDGPGDVGSTALRDRVWRPNRLSRYSKMVNWAALVYGDAYLIIWPGEADGTVDVHYNSPVGTRVFYDEEDPRRKRYAAKLWTQGREEEQRTRVNLYYPERVERYISLGTDAVDDAHFEPYSDELDVDGEPVWPIPNPFNELPVFHFRTAEPYGVPEHKGAWGPQNAITKLSATQMATIDFQGFPQRYALMTSDAADLVDWDDDDEGGLTAEPRRPGDRQASLKASPGELWKLPGASKVGQFDPADVEAFLKPIGLYARLMASSTATPLRFFDPTGQIPSGEALRADEAPLASRIVDRQEWLGETWSESLVFAGRVVGLALPGVDVRWAPVQIVNDKEGWETVRMKLDAGVPFVQVMTEAGYASDVVAQWDAQRREAAGREEGTP